VLLSTGMGRVAADGDLVAASEDVHDSLAVTAR
jgi:hypothetical protein